MRISDWSSDVCSSDLFALDRVALRIEGRARAQIAFIIRVGLIKLGREGMLQIGADDLARTEVDGQVMPFLGGDAGKLPFHQRSEGRRVGKGEVSTYSFWGWATNGKNKQKKQYKRKY